MKQGKQMLNLIVGYVLGIFSAFILLCLLVTHRAPPPTKAKRRQPNAQGENGDVDYTFMGATGLED